MDNSGEASATEETESFVFDGEFHETPPESFFADVDLEKEEEANSDDKFGHISLHNSLVYPSIRRLGSWRPFMSLFLRDTFTLLYASHFLSSWGDRIGTFFLPIALSTLWPSTIFPTSFVLFISNLLSFFFVPMMGQWVDRSHRLRAVTVSLFVQNISLLLSFLCLRLCFPFTNSQTFPVTSSYPLLVIFVLLSCLNALSSLFSTASSIAVERDWVVAICCGHRHLLSETNAIMQRIDLICNTVAPVLMGLILSLSHSYSLNVGLWVVCVWNVISVIPEYLLLLFIYKRHNRILRKTHPTTENTRVHPLTYLVMGWKDYVNQPVLLASLAFTFLYFTVLNPGGLMTSFLKSKNVADGILGVFVALSAVSGVLATFAVPKLLQHFSTSLVGILMIWSQWTTLLPGVVVFFFQPDWVVYMFLMSIVISRFGLWGFDLAERQIMQESIEESLRGSVNGVENALTNLFTLLVTILGMIFSKPFQFGVLCAASITAVGAAALSFSTWVFLNEFKRSPKITTETELENLDLSLSGSSHVEVKMEEAANLTL